MLSARDALSRVSSLSARNSSVADAFRQERLLGDRRVFEHLVEPGDHTRIPGDRRCDSPNVLDQRCAAGIALLLVKPFGERPSALSI